MGKKKVVLDTNILISALGWKGNPKNIFEKCLQGELELITSPAQLDEVMRIMEYHKFDFTEEQKLTFLGIITAIATIVHTTGDLKVIEQDPDDDVILETAIVGVVDYIISGDPHLHKIEKYKKIKIVTAQQFLELTFSA